jgi:hypothetical protein
VFFVYFNILGDRRHLDGLGASKMLVFPPFFEMILFFIAIYCRASWKSLHFSSVTPL